MTLTRPPRRIHVVAFEMEDRPTGVGRYLEGLLGGAAALDTDDRWTLFFKGAPFDHPLWTIDRGAAAGRFEAVFDHRPRARPILWEQLRLPRLLRERPADIVFAPSYSLPPRLGLPSVVTIHDLSFERFPDAFPGKERWRRRFLARRAARRATRVLADTTAIAVELATTYRLPRAKIGVVPLAVDDRFEPRPAAGDATTRAALGVDDRYLLVLGTVFARRRPDLVLAAFATVAPDHPGLQLVFAGANRLRHPAELDALIASSSVAERVVRLGYVPEASLPALYRGALGSLYLSSYEGFGLPPLESLACGTPAVVASGLGLDDLWPDYPFRCPSLALDDVEPVLRRLLADDDARRAVGADGAARMADLTWRASARRLLEEIDIACRP